jgi:hypothetical protein
MFLREGMARTAFEILLEVPRQIQGFKGRIKLDFPWLAFGCVEAFAGVVLRDAPLKIVRVASVKFT